MKFAFSIGMAVLALFASGCTDRTGPQPQEAPRGADQVLSGLSTQLFTSGRRSLRLDGEQAYVYNDSATVWVFSASATSFRPDGNLASMLEADSARLDQRASHLTFWGAVTVQNGAGDLRLETDYLTYDATGDRFRTESGFTFRERGRVTEGSCFESDATLDDWRACQ